MKIKDFVNLNEEYTGIKKEIIEWFRDNPNPSDKAVHSFAKDKGFNEHKFEEIIYQLVSDHAKMV